METTIDLSIEFPLQLLIFDQMLSSYKKCNNDIEKIENNM